MSRYTASTRPPPACTHSRLRHMQRPVLLSFILLLFFIHFIFFLFILIFFSFLRFYFFLVIFFRSSCSRTPQSRSLTVLHRVCVPVRRGEEPDSIGPRLGFSRTRRRPTTDRAHEETNAVSCNKKDRRAEAGGRVGGGAKRGLSQ